jgi:hypothetical protein
MEAMFTKPAIDELSDYYRTYWKYLDNDDMLGELIRQEKEASDFLLSINADKSDYAYEEGKWMLKEVVGHLSDTERILTYRALRFSRNDSTELPGFDENSYMEHSNFRSRHLPEIIDEFISVRKATISLFSSMSDEMLDLKGVANGNTVSPRSLLYFIIGHTRHHLLVIRDRYLIS